MSLVLSWGIGAARTSVVRPCILATLPIKALGRLLALALVYHCPCRWLRSFQQRTGFGRVSVESLDFRV